MNQISALSALLTPKHCNRPELSRMPSLVPFDQVWRFIPDSVDNPGLSQDPGIMPESLDSVKICSNPGI
jgi:hypothetical protein